MPLQLNIFLLLFGGLQALLFTLFLIRKKFYRKGYVFLLIYFGVMMLQILLKVVSKAWLLDNWNATYWLSYELPYLYGPLMYLFVRRQSFKPIDSLHFVPFFAFAFFILLYPPDRLACELLSIGIYHFLAYRLSEGWLKKFTVWSFAVCSIIAITIYFMYMYFPALNWIRMGFLALTIFIYWVSYQALNQPEIFSINRTIPKLQVVKKYTNSGLPEQEALRISASLENLMASEKIYLDPQITIDSLAKTLNTNRHHLSQVLNQKLGLSFYDYINTYRVNEAKLLLINRSGHKISAIAYDSGFNSLSAFNEVFKKFTGQTPSQYRKQPEETIKQQRI